QIARGPGGTILYGPPDGRSPLFGLADFDRGQVIKSMPIPAIKYGNSIQLSTVTTGRAIFTAAAVPVYDPIRLYAPPLPEINPNNDNKTVDALVRHTYPVNSATLNLVPALRNAVQNARVRLDRNDSYVTIPNLMDRHFSLPGKDVGVNLGLFSPTVTYYVNDLRSTGASLTYERGGLAMTFRFADNNHALHTPSFAPDVSVRNLRVKVYLPLSYNATYQYFLFGDPRVETQGDWSANGPLGPAIKLLLPDFNQKVS